MASDISRSSCFSTMALNLEVLEERSTIESASAVGSLPRGVARTLSCLLPL